MARFEELLKKMDLKLKEFKTNALKFKPTLKPKVSAGHKLKPLPSRPKYGNRRSVNQPKTGIAPVSNKNPKNVAQQIKNPEAKKDALQRAKSLVKYFPNGQWILEKTSFYNKK
jgi:hypothetical protein